MKKFILLILMTLTALTVGGKVFAASETTYKVTSYEKVSKTNILMGNYYLINYFFYSESDMDLLEDYDEGDLQSGYLDADNVEPNLINLGWEFPESLTNIVKECHYTTTNISVFYLVKPQTNYDISEKDIGISRVYKLEVTELPKITSDEIHEINYDHLLTLDEIKARYSATDNYDKDLTSQIVFESNYPAVKEEIKLGEYYIKATVKDSSQNTASVTNKIVVIDTTKPVFTGTLSYIIEYGEAFATENIINGLSCTDNYEKTIAKEKFKITGNKQYDPELLGNQAFEVSYTDGSGNTGKCTVNVKLVDSVAPIITVIDTVKVNPTRKLNEEEILELLRNSNRISDDYLEANIESEYFNSDEEGIYTSLCTVKEKDGSISRYRFKIDLNNNNAIPTNPNNTNLWIIVGVTSGLVLIGAGVGLFFYIKKKKELIKLQ